MYINFSTLACICYYHYFLHQIDARVLGHVKVFKLQIQESLKFLEELSDCQFKEGPPVRD
jgi:hypothetical protein